MTRQKYCKDCDEIKPIDSFYRAGKISYQTRCKPCHNLHRQELRDAKRKVKTKRLNPFRKLPQDKQDELLKYLDTMPLTKLAIKMAIDKNTLSSWKRLGYLVCNKRTDAESKRLAEEYHAEIIKKHQEWVDSLPKKVKKEKSYKTYPFTYNERVDQVHCSICDHYFQKKSLWKHKITPTHTKNVARTELLIAAGE